MILDDVSAMRSRSEKTLKKLGKNRPKFPSNSPPNTIQLIFSAIFHQKKQK
jgi:hypothetical protein